MDRQNLAAKRSKAIKLIGKIKLKMNTDYLNNDRRYENKFRPKRTLQGLLIIGISVFTLAQVVTRLLFVFE